MRYWHHKGRTQPYGHAHALTMTKLVGNYSRSSELITVSFPSVQKIHRMRLAATIVTLVMCLCPSSQAFSSLTQLRTTIHPPLTLTAHTNSNSNINGNANASNDTTTSTPSRRLLRHVAFVCDGNSRWAKARYLPASVGHAAGANRILESLTTLQKAGVKYCTMYGFSTENWKRSPKEVRDILLLIEQVATSYYQKAMDDNVRVKILGDIDDVRIPASLREALRKLQRDTAGDGTCTKQLTVCLAVNYGGRRDIINASLQLGKAIAAGQINPSTVSEADFSALLCTNGIPEPDLVIRTGGEKRLSNFLLYDAAYAELFFTDTLWPDFDASRLEEAFVWFASRSRRFGGCTASGTSDSR
jgi:undecaprenyl diphosphate synthase